MLKVLEFEREYLCLKCKKSFKVHADFNQYYIIAKPTSCNTDGCQSNNFIATNEAGKLNGMSLINLMKPYTHIHVFLIELLVL